MRELELGTGKPTSLLPYVISEAKALHHWQHRRDIEDVRALLHLFRQDLATPFGEHTMQFAWEKEVDTLLTLKSIDCVL